MADDACARRSAGRCCRCRTTTASCRFPNLETERARVDPRHPQHAAGRAADAPGFRRRPRRLLHEPNTLATRRSIRDCVQASLTRWERRILLDRVEVWEVANEPVHVSVEIAYRLARTGAPGAMHAHRAARRLTDARMPILPPGLDDRSFDDLVEDLIARIPAHTPEWTNPRLGDPGRTLIELFAWLGDTLLYRANLIPERQRLAFLALLGIGLKPARGRDRHRQPVATPSRPSGARCTLRPGARVNGPVAVRDAGRNDGAAGLRRGVHQARARATPRATQAGELIAGLARIHGISGPAKGYQTMPVFDSGRAEPAGIDVFAESADHALWIALLAPEAPRPDQQLAVNEAVACRARRRRHRRAVR